MNRKASWTAFAALLVLAATGPASASVCEFDDIAIFATNSIRLGTGVTVTGNVVANDSSPGPVLDEGVELALDRDATVTGDATAVSVDLDSGASVSGTLTCDTGDAACTGFVPPAFEATDIPAFLEADVRPDAEDVFVGDGEVKILGASGLVCSVALTSCTEDGDCPAGEACIAGRTASYGDIVVNQGGTLVFAEGGRFDVRSITATATAGQCDPCRSIEFDAPTELRVEGRFDSERGAYVGPTAGSGIAASDIAIHVGGQNGATGGLFEVPRAAGIGRDSEVHASFYVPYGTFELEKDSTMSGAILAADAQIDKDSIFTGDSAFANKAPTADDKDAFTNDQASIAIGLTGSDPEGQVLTFAKASDPGSGSVSVAGSTATYTPTDQFANAEDSFTYTATDECGAVSATATVRVNPPGDPIVQCTQNSDCDPGQTCNTVTNVCELGEVVANDQLCASTDPIDCSLETIEATPITIILTGTAPCELVEPDEGEIGDENNPPVPCQGEGNDVPLTFSLPSTTTDQGGTLAGLNQGTGELQEPPGPDEVPQRSASVLYTPPPAVGGVPFTGVDSFTFEVKGDVNNDTDTTDPGETDGATVEISVQAFTPIPDVVARDQIVSIQPQTPVEINLSGPTGAAVCDPNDPDCCDPEDDECRGSESAAASLISPSTAAPTPSDEALAERQAYARSLAGRRASLFAPQPLASSTELAAAMDIPAGLISASSITGEPQASAAPTNLGVIQPLQGGSFAVLSTGIVGTQAEGGTDFGTSGPEGDKVVLTFVLNVPESDGVVSFDFNFLSAEYPEFIDAGFNDTFRASLTDQDPQTGGQRTRTVALAEVDEVVFLPVTQDNAGGSGFDVFDELGNADAGLTGFQSASAVYSALNGQITLEFSIEDVGDGILDTAVILDNVAFVEQSGYTILTLPTVGTLSYLDPLTDVQTTITAADLPLALPLEQVIYEPPGDAEPGPLASFTYLVSDGLTSATGTINLVLAELVVVADSCAAVGRPPGCEAEGLTAGSSSGDSSTSGEEADDGIRADHNLRVKVTGSGTGTITSSRRQTPQGSLHGLSCDSRCGMKFTDGAEVVLYARPIGDDSEFIGWGGDCSGFEPMTTVRVHARTRCTATFESR